MTISTPPPPSTMSVDYAEVVRDLEERKGQIEAALLALRPLARAFSRVPYEGNGAAALAQPRIERDELPGTPHEAIPPVDLAGAIAARTTGSAPKAHAPRTPEEIDEVLEQTRKDVAQMSEARGDRGNKGVAYGTKVEPGRGAGTGRRVCQSCWTVNNLKEKKCRDCGKKL